MPRYRHARRKPTPCAKVACRSLMVVDSVRVRKRALGNCRRARTTFEKAERELAEFESGIQPAYDRWHRNTFGPRLREIRTLEERIRELHTKLEMLDDIMHRLGCGPREAMDFLENGMHETGGENPFEEDAEAFQEALREQEAWMVELEEALAHALEENRGRIEEALAAGTPAAALMTRLLQAFAGQMRLDDEEMLMFFPRPKVRQLLVEAGLLEKSESASRKSPEDPEVHKRVRIKKLMRELAFSLHPDQCGEHDEQKLKLWHRVRDAAERGDLDELEVLHAHMQLLTGDVGPGVSVGRLIDLTQMFRQSRAAIRRQLQRFRKSPAWIFHRADDRERATLRRELEREYREELHVRRHHLRSLEREWRNLERG